MLEKLKKSRAAKITGICLYFLILISAIALDIHILTGENSPIKFKEDTSEDQQHEDIADENDIIETAKATITVTGDIMSHMPIINSAYNAGSYSFENIFTNIKKYVSEADFAVGNLETTLAGTENGNIYSGYPQFNCPDTIVDAAKNAGFDLLLTANNHSYDTGSYGMKRTQEIVRQKGLLNLGTRMSAEEPKYLVQDINGIKIGMVCYTYGEIDSSTGQAAVNGIPVSIEQSANINVFDYTKLDRFYTEMEKHISDMKANGAEAIVLFIHWGVEYQIKHNQDQTNIAQKMCDLGVDVIAGGHPHVIQPVQLLTSNTNTEHKTLCVYSMGNAVSNQRTTAMNLKTGHTEDGMLFSFTFVKYSDGNVRLDNADILPTWVYLSNGDYSIIPLDKEISDWKTAFNIGSNGLNSANASYERTMALVDDALNSAMVNLEEAVSMQEAGIVAAVG